jgi:hypothetical protein
VATIPQQDVGRLEGVSHDWYLGQELDGSRLKWLFERYDRAWLHLASPSQVELGKESVRQPESDSLWQSLGNSAR